MTKLPADNSPGNMQFALSRFARALNERATTAATVAAADAGISISNDISDALAVHAAASQFVHGVGPLFVVKTRNSNQYPDWSEIQHKPTIIGSDFDPTTLTLTTEQIISGIMNIFRLPVAAPGEVSTTKLVRADDPRLQAQQISMVTAEPLSTGDFVRASAAGCYRAIATAIDSPAIGFVATSYGTGDIAQIFPYGENGNVFLAGASADAIGKPVYISTTAGQVALTPPTASGSLIQPVGSVDRVLSGTLVAVVVRYEYRIQNL